jgi:hypothetical protein
MTITLRPLIWVAESLVDGNKLTKRLTVGRAIRVQLGHLSGCQAQSGVCDLRINIKLWGGCG